MSEWFIAFVLVLLAAVAGVTAIPNTIFLIEVVAATLYRWRMRTSQFGPSRPHVGVIVPARNESTNLIPTIADLKAQLRLGDRLLVVADNCSDDTAVVAELAGAEVIVRSDFTKIGKGYALDLGTRYLTGDPPSIVIVIDADCRLSVDAVDQLVRVTSTTGRPTQALYLMTAPTGSPGNYQVAEFAWRVKNWVRPLGLHAMNLPCQLVGTGMAFPWAVIRSANLATDHLVEDLKLGLDLAAAGHPPLFCPAAIVKSTFPPTLKGVASQRERWEHGHVGLSLTQAPGLIYRALKSGNMDLLTLALDIAVPPLTLLAYLNALVFLITSLPLLFGAAPICFYLSAVSLACFLMAVFLAWLTDGRDVLPVYSVLRVGSYIFAKLRLYLRLLWHGPVSQWTRTDRK